MVHRFLVAAVVVLLGAGVSHAQRPVTSGEIIAFARNLGGGHVWQGLMSQTTNQTFMLPGDLEVTIGMDFLVQALIVYRSNFGLIGQGCNAIEMGLGMCNTRRAPMLAVTWDREFALLGPGWPCSGSQWRAVHMPLFSSVNQTNNGCLATDTQVVNDLISWGYFAGETHANARVRAWWREKSSSHPEGYLAERSEWLETLNVEPLTTSQWNTTLAGMVNAAVLFDMPTVQDLIDDWGVAVSGYFSDEGWEDPGEYEDDEGPGGGGGPEDPETNCGILDIPCNLRRLFIPQQDWGATWGSLDTSDKFPFGLAAWLPSTDCSVLEGEGGTYEGCGPGIGQDRTELVYGSEPGEVYGTLKACIPHPGLVLPQLPRGGTGPGFDCIEYDLLGSPLVVLWHEHLRIWLYWLFVAQFSLWALRQFIS